MIDPYGNLLLAQRDTFNVSPINTAVLNLVDKYYNTYFQLINDISNTTLGGYKQSEPYQFLPNPRDCTFVLLNAPSGKDPLSLQNLGLIFFIINTEK